MASHGITAEEAKRRAEMRFQKNAQRENEIRQASEAERTRIAAEAAKIDKLRALRLAKEAQDRIGAAAAKQKKAVAAAS
jgi:hypothetical protein